MARPIGGGGGRLGRLVAGVSDLEWLVVTADVEAMAPPDQEGRRWSHKNIDPIMGGGNEGK